MPWPQYAIFSGAMKDRLFPELDDELIDVRLLRMFDLIYSTRSVTRAAEQLGQKQPTISIWLGKLRQQLGDPLFVRTPCGMLPQLLAHVRGVAPRVRLVAARIDDETAHALESGGADMALGFVPWLESGFYQQTLFPQDWVCLVSSKHPRIRDTLTLRAYNDEGHVAITGGTGAQLLEDTMRRQSIRRRVVCELPGFLGLSGIVSATDLIATSPRQIGETLAGMANLKV